MLVDKKDACLVIFNMQLDLIPLLEDGTSVLNSCCWLTDIANTLGIPVSIIEHKKLGNPSLSLKDVSGGARYLEKYHFDCMAHEHIRDHLFAMGRSQFILAGAESHVCIYQSALALRQAGKEVFVVQDACSARNRNDHDIALNRMRESRMSLISKEMVFFEAIRHSEFPEYVETAMRYLDGRYIR